MKKKRILDLNEEVKAQGQDCFADFLIDGVNYRGQIGSEESADKWLDEQVARVYKEDRVILLNMLHNCAMDRRYGVAYSGTADSLFCKLLLRWFK